MQKIREINIKIKRASLFKPNQTDNHLLFSEIKPKNNKKENTNSKIHIHLASKIGQTIKTSLLKKHIHQKDNTLFSIITEKGKLDTIILPQLKIDDITTPYKYINPQTFHKLSSQEIKTIIDLEPIRKLASKWIKSTLHDNQFNIIFPDKLLEQRKLSAFIEGCYLGSYTFDKYKIESQGNSIQNSITLTLVINDEKDIKKIKNIISKAFKISQGSMEARNLTNEPVNKLNVKELVIYAKNQAKTYKYNCTILGKKELMKLKMNGILAVNQGSTHEPALIINEYKSKRKTSNQTILLVGKGVMFDTGGISLKPSTNMDAMKMDMAGGACVISTMQTIAQLQLPINVIGIVPATDNMPSGSATCPGDVIQMYNGKTVEILNTDAEGRLILADAIAYGAQQYKPDTIIDLATLTGACVIALGNYAAALYSNDYQLQERICIAGDKAGEQCWPMPLYDQYAKQLDSTIADLQNIGGRNAGSVTAAKFLESFIPKGIKWAHLDIAGTAMLEKANGYYTKGGSGYGVRILIEYLHSLI